MSLLTLFMSAIFLDSCDGLRPDSRHTSACFLPSTKWLYSALSTVSPVIPVKPIKRCKCSGSTLPGARSRFATAIYCSRGENNFTVIGKFSHETDSAESGLQCHFKRTADNNLVNAQVRLAVIEAGVTEDCLHGLHVTGCSQHLCRQ